jgi:hypothetical protein
MAEHCNPNARDELARLWKERIRERIASGASAAVGAGGEMDDEALPMEEEE